MDSLPSVWTSDHESMAELLHKLFCATSELEALRGSIKEERKERVEGIIRLTQILESTTQERNKAREQLQFLLNKTSEPNFLAELFRCLSHPYPHGPQIWEPRGNFMVTVPEDPSETQSHHSCGSSPVKSFNVASTNGADPRTMGLPQKPLIRRCENDRSSSRMISPGTAKRDRADAIIHTLSKEKRLPEKGKLLETVLNIGPTLEDLMVAGPLPRWRNPPPLQSLHVPPVKIKACYAQLRNRATLEDLMVAGPRPRWRNPPPLQSLQVPPVKIKACYAQLRNRATLEDLMVAGPLPRWRNPPPLQSLQVPPVKINACYAQLRNRAAILNSNHWIRSSENSNGMSRVQAAPISGFSGKASLHGRTLPGVGSNRRFEAKREGTQ